MPPTDWQLPWPSRRSPVLAANMVATSQPLAAQAGLHILRAGGNAVDAAVACAMALTVLEPTGCGVGSDAFCIVWDGQQLHGLNASGRAPQRWSADYFAAHGGRIPEVGIDSVTVPGAVSSWAALSRRFGTLPLTQLAQSAVHYAREGFAVSPTIAAQWQAGAERLGTQPGFAECFLPQGRAPQAGEWFRCPALGETLEEIAATQGESFYRGALARKIAAHARRLGGALDEGDLGAHQADWVGTIGQRFGDSVIHEIPPNGQGIATLMALGMLEAVDIGACGPPDSAPSLHRQIEAMKLALADLHQYNADAAHMRVSCAGLLDAAYLQKRAQAINPRHAGTPAYGAPGPGGTVYLATADAGGMMVSFIQSNYMGFGSGVVVPGTGISLQNRGCGFHLEAGHANRVAPGKRPSHTILPAFAMHKDGWAQMAFGVMGGPMQSQGHVQMALRVLGCGQNPQAAADAPRWRVLGGKSVAVEAHMPAQTIAQLRALGHDIQVTPPQLFGGFGGAQLILRAQAADAHYTGGSDPRKDGGVVGF